MKTATTRILIVFTLLTFPINTLYGQEPLILLEKDTSHILTQEALNLGDPTFPTPRTSSGFAFLGNFNHHISSQDGLVSHGDYQYAVYYNKDRHVVLARRSHDSFDWNEIVFDDYVQGVNDAHNYISMGISPNDGTIHFSFDHHRDTLHYRHSTVNVLANANNWQKSLFSQVKNHLPKKNEGQPQDPTTEDIITRVTYPRFITTPDGNLQFAYRSGSSGDGEDRIVTYSPDKGWRDNHVIISKEGTFRTIVEGEPRVTQSRNAYINYYTYDKDGVLHISWTFRERGGGFDNGPASNHNLYYAYSEDQGNTWLNTWGREVGNFATDKKIDIHSPGIQVAEIPFGRLLNNGGQAMDSRGRLHVILYFTGTVGDPGHYKHYWRNPGGNWQSDGNRINFSGSRARLYIDKNDNLLMCSSVWGTIRVLTASAFDNYASWTPLFNAYSNLRGDVSGDQVLLREKGILSMGLQKRPTPSGYEPTPIEIFDLQFEYPATQNPPVVTNDFSEDNTPGNRVFIPILSNDRLGNGAKITNMDQVSVDLKPSTPEIDHERIVPGEGKWAVGELYKHWVVGFEPEDNFLDDPRRISYRIKDEENGEFSTRANIKVTYNQPNDPIANDDISRDNPRDKWVWIPILRNDTFADGSEIPGKEAVTIDLKPWTTEIDSVLRVEGEGVWSVGELYDTCVVIFVADSTLVNNPRGIIYKLTDKETGLSDEARIRATFKTTSNNTISVYPNPVQGELTISRIGNDPIDSIKIYNNQGILVSENFEIDFKEKQINVLGYPPGLYYVEIWAKGQRTMKKIIVR